MSGGESREHVGRSGNVAENNGARGEISGESGSMSRAGGKAKGSQVSVQTSLVNSIIHTDCDWSPCIVSPSFDLLGHSVVKT